MASIDRSDPVILGHVLAEHQDLFNRLTAARKAFAAEAPPGREQLAALQQGLTALRDHLHEHFTQEERGGFLEEAVARMPRLGSAMATLVAEHPALLAELDKLTPPCHHLGIPRRLGIRPVRPLPASPIACWPTRGAKMQSFRKATTKTWGSISGGLVVATFVAAFALADEPSTPRPDDVAPFMRAKLTHAQDVLEGLSLGDFAAIRRGAQELALASQAASWQVLQTVEYARQSAEFRRSCESLKNAAREENLDGATLAWMEVTMKCVQCHKYVRGEASPTPR